MKSKLLAATGAALFALTAAAPPAAAAGGWGGPVTLAPAAANGGVMTSDQTSDAAGNVTVAYSACGSGECSLYVASRDASTADWTEPDRLHGPVTEDLYVVGPNAIDIESNADGDLALVWQTCELLASRCFPRVALRAAESEGWSEHELVAGALYDEHEHGHHHFGPDVAVAPDGSATVAWSVRHADGGIQPGELVVRDVSVDDPDAAVPQLVFGGAAQKLSTAGMQAPDNAEIAMSDDGTAVASWWHYAGGACSTIAFSVRTAALAWTPAQSVDGVICDSEALAMDTPEVAAYGAAGDVILAWSTSVWGDPASGTTVASIDADGVIERRHKISTRRMGLHADVTAGDRDYARAQFSRNVHGEVVLGASEADPALGQDRPMIVVRDTGGSWGSPVAIDGYTTNNVVLNPPPGVAIDDSGISHVAYTVRVPVEGTMFSNAEIRTAQVVRGGATPTGAVKVSREGVESDRPLLSRGAGGTPVAVWRRVHPDLNYNVSLDTAELWTGPDASFTYAPASPIAGKAVAFTSTSTDPDEATAALTHAWDIDGDGIFDDATGSTAVATFPAAGDYAVELKVTDADEQTDYASGVISVQAAPGGGDGPGTDPGSGDGNDNGGNQPPADPQPPAQPQPEPLPKGFVVKSTIDTNGARPIPAVAGRPLDDARDRVVKALVYADVKTERVTSDSSKLGKRPGGGKWKIGDVVSQSPVAGTRANGSAAAPAAVKLTYWAGAKSNKKRCDELRSVVKGDELDLALAQLKAAGCKTPDLVLKASKSVDDPTVKSLSKDNRDLTVTVPVDQSKTDIVIWKNTGFLGTSDPGPVPSASGDLQLTAGQRNVAGLVLRDRAGRALNRATVTWDLSGAGGGEVTSKSIESGVAPVKITPARAGTVRVLVSWSDASGDSIYGYAEFKVVDRSSQPGFVTAIGQSFKRSGTGKSALFKPGSFKASNRAARLPGTTYDSRLGIGDFWNAMAAVFRSWGGAVASAASATAESVLGISKTHGASVTQLWRGPVSNGLPQPIQNKSVGSGLWMISPSGVVSAGGGNVVAAGGGNVVAAGGMNVIAAGGGNVVSAGGGNILTLPDGAKVVAAGGGNVVAAGGGNVIAVGGGNVVAAGGLN